LEGRPATLMRIGADGFRVTFGATDAGS